MYREKKHRLPPEAYFGPKTVSITACTLDRKPFLTNQRLIEDLVSMLKDATEKHHCLVPIYCFMPDHLHLFIQGTEFKSRPKVAMDVFKGVSGDWLAEHWPGCDWQDGYHDHILRGKEDWKNKAFYVFRNPVRKGLVADPYEYPFTGSIGYELDALFAEICW